MKSAVLLLMIALVVTVVTTNGRQVDEEFMDLSAEGEDEALLQMLENLPRKKPSKCRANPHCYPNLGDTEYASNSNTADTTNEKSQDFFDDTARSQQQNYGSSQRERLHKDSERSHKNPRKFHTRSPRIERRFTGDEDIMQLERLLSATDVPRIERRYSDDIGNPQIDRRQSDKGVPQIDRRYSDDSGNPQIDRRQSDQGVPQIDRRYSDDSGNPQIDRRQSDKGVPQIDRRYSDDSGNPQIDRRQSDKGVPQIDRRYSDNSGTPQVNHQPFGDANPQIQSRYSGYNKNLQRARLLSAIDSLLVERGYIDSSGRLQRNQLVHNKDAPQMNRRRNSGDAEIPQIDRRQSGPEAPERKGRISGDYERSQALGGTGKSDDDEQPDIIESPLENYGRQREQRKYFDGAFTECPEERPDCDNPQQQGIDFRDGESDDLISLSIQRSSSGDASGAADRMSKGRTLDVIADDEKYDRAEKVPEMSTEELLDLLEKLTRKKRQQKTHAT